MEKSLEILNQYLPILKTKAAGFLMTILCIYIIIQILRILLSKNIKDSNVRYRVNKLLSITSLGLIIFSGIVVFGNKLNNLTVAFGLISAGIAFALQGIIGSFFAWFYITFDKVYQTGDRIFADNVCGDVIDIGFLKTTLMECGSWVNGDLYTGRIVKISNSFALNNSVFNYSQNFPFLWDEINIPIKHGSDILATRELIQKSANKIVGEYSKKALKSWGKVVRKYLIENAQTTPMVSLTADENWLNFTLRYVCDYKLRRKTKDLLFEDIFLEINNNEKIEIAGTALELTSLPKLEVSLK